MMLDNTFLSFFIFSHVIQELFILRLIAFFSIWSPAERRCGTLETTRDIPLERSLVLITFGLHIEGEERGGINSINDLRGWRTRWDLRGSWSSSTTYQSLNVPRGDNQFYSKGKEAGTQGEGAR